MKDSLADSGRARCHRLRAVFLSETIKNVSTIRSETWHQRQHQSTIERQEWCEQGRMVVLIFLKIEIMEIESGQYLH
jgi:hypothetical protein